jgi:creatinine amidohydrolase/Fe(II)-dependent formamide hydrolase-like protein
MDMESIPLACTVIAHNYVSNEILRSEGQQRRRAHFVAGHDGNSEVKQSAADAHSSRQTYRVSLSDMAGRCGRRRV